MPYAGAIVPPVIIPLRKQMPGKPQNNIDTASYIELSESETPDCKIYFSTDGTKPNPFQLKFAGREQTFKYRGPFTLKPGKRTVKTVAVTRDGRESNVVTKTFQVEDVGPPTEEDFDNLIESFASDSHPEPQYSNKTPRRTNTIKSRKTLRNSSKALSTSKPKEAWGSTNGTLSNGNTTSYDITKGMTDGMLTGLGDTSSSNVNIPDGPFNPTNYSGTQVNFWGVCPGNLPGLPNGGGYSGPYPQMPSQMGMMTGKMIQDLQEPKMTVAEVKQLLKEQEERIRREQPPPQPVVELPVKEDPEAKPKSPGKGDWKGQLEHIYAHLFEQCREDMIFRAKLSEPIMGRIATVDFDEEDDAYLLTVSLAKPGGGRPKVKPKAANVVKATKSKPVHKKPPTPPPEPPPPEPPKKRVPAKVKKEPVKKKDPYFITEEYENARNKQKSLPKSRPEQKPNQSSGRNRIKSPRSKPPPPPPSPPPQPIKSSSSEESLHSEEPELNVEFPEPELNVEFPEPELNVEFPEPELDVEFSEPEQGEIEEEAPEEDPWPIDPYYLTEEYEQEGTIKPWPTFNAEYDCERLNKAMKGMGTEEQEIINVLGYRCSTQRQELVLTYKTMFGKDLMAHLKDELSGDFKQACVALCLPPDEYDASEINRAIKGLGTDEDALVEILCTRTNAQIRALNEAYERLYDKKMEKDIKGDTSGQFGKLLLSQCAAKRSEDPEFDQTAAEEDAKALYAAGEKKWGTDESMFNMILMQRSFPHLRATFEEYQKLSKKTMEEVIKSEFSGDLMQGFLAVVRCIQDKPLYFGRKMQKAMKGLGTDDQALIRVIVSRSECDMVQIMAAFEKEFKKGTLCDWIRDDTGGDYGDLLLALTGGRPPPSASAEEEEAAGPPELEEIEEENLPQEGTVKPAEPFDPNADADKLKKAMKGFGTDEKAIIEVWGHRDNAQRLEIIKAYSSKFSKDLLKELKSELGGNFCTAVLALGQSPADYDANELRKSMKGLGTDEDTLIEICCTRTNEEMAALQEAYTRIHRRKLEDDIKSETSGDIKKLLVSMVQANRPDSGNTIDRKKARNDAKALFEAGEKKFGTDESRFNVVLCSRSFPQLRATFEEYQKLANKDIEEVIKSEMSGDLKKGMLTIVRCVKNKVGQFAKRLHDSMAGLGTDDDTLIRVTVSRAEIDMVQIKEFFEQCYGQPLGKFTADDTSGDYRKILLAVMGEEQHLKK